MSEPKNLGFMSRLGLVITLQMMLQLLKLHKEDMNTHDKTIMYSLFKYDISMSYISGWFDLLP